MLRTGDQCSVHLSSALRQARTAKQERDCGAEGQEAASSETGPTTTVFSLSDAAHKQKSGLLGTLIPDLFRPRVFLQAEFPRSGAAVQLGNEVSPEAAKEEPRVQFVAEDPAATSEALYTLVVVDPDAPSRSAPNASPFLHLVLPGLKPPSLDRLAATGETGDVAAAEGSMVEKTQAAWVEWTGPAPPEGAGVDAELKEDAGWPSPHRYVYLLYLQPPPAAGSVFLPGRSPSISTPEARQNFDLDAFVEDHELVLVGANFMLASRPGLFDLRRSSPL
ncbi:SPOSA6832_00907 [Sporobolomyces salmonicolor]|uniref:SPOSA6832_00907-mRNA-1:cds n=1 Tax=Sporidiobolus salmonicolor TaxID=5005 RepID=A0A0D6EH91_SPOSA|nr:SPOSA6832_00907 [Sporobolomyces salmonicolor]